MQEILIHSFIHILMFILIVYFIALVKKDNSIVYIAWGIGFIIVAFTSLFISQIYFQQNLLINAITLIWGLRLAIYIFIRHHGKAEDYRYKEMRDSWGNNAALMSLLKVFLPQAIVMFIITMPVMISNSFPENELGWIEILGALIWLKGFFFEAVGDAQMYRYKKNPAHKGKVMKFGLWKFTRHPNYFGEVIMWWGIFLIAAPSGYWYLSLLSPVVITLLIIKVTGVELLEKKYKDNAEYQDYIRKTSSFIPWFPKK